MRPELRSNLDIDSFNKFYWLKEELQKFAKENGISASGSKMEIAERIETFLVTGVILKPVRKSKVGQKKDSQCELSLDTVITENHRCSQNVREFFKSVIPNFHFSTYIQNYFKENAGKTYRNVINAWFEEKERKKDPLYKIQIPQQFEYNQFIRDFFADPHNQGKTHKEAVAAWKVIKQLPGSNKYQQNSTDL